MDLTDLGKPLETHQISFRVQSISANGWATVLAYKDARVDMDRLDQVVGRGKWQRKHERIDGDLFCSVGLFNKDINQWVWVQDVGTPSKTEKTKGESSDAFKRACFNLGIGRELYDFPLILIQLKPNEFTVAEVKGKKKGFATWDLRIKDWLWYMERDENSLTFLAATDGHSDNKARFTYGRRKK